MQNTINKALNPALRQPHVSGSVASRPIIFSSEMVREILAGRKTQTRRIIKPQPTTVVQDIVGNFYEVSHRESGIGEYEDIIKCPYGMAADMDFLWVREAYSKNYFNTGIHAYKADFKEVAAEYVPVPKWKPSIHMPKSAARIFLKINDVKVERLQSISEEDAQREGVKYDLSLEFNQYLNYEKGIYQCQTAVESFKSLWSEINGEKSWSENPFVWVIQFERVELSEHYR